ncbi:MAG: DVU0298 family protein [Bacillota bacterium]
MTLRDRVVALLRAADWEALEAESRLDTRVLNALIQALYLPDEEVAWRAAEGFGRAAAIAAGVDIELCRDRIGRLTWALNEKAEISARFAAPAIGEAIARAPQAFVENAPVLLAALGQQYLQAGAAWALGRIGSAWPDMVRPAAARVLPLLRSEDPAVRGNAAWALGQMLAEEALEELEALAGDTATFGMYSGGSLHEMRVGELATAACEKIRDSLG